MADFFFVIMLAICLGLFGGLICLVYLPFKYRLLKSGRLTERVNRQINRAFILLLCVTGFVLYFFKDYRTSSKDRLERISNVNLPTDFKVIKDEYQDMMQDYCIIYEIQFEHSATSELIKNIQSSKFYNSNVNPYSMLYDSLYITVENEKAIWCKSDNGYRFGRNEELTSYSIEFDTLTNILKYNECAD